MRHPLKRIRAVYLPGTKSAKEMSHAEALALLQTILDQRDMLVQDLLKALDEDGVHLSGDLFEDVEAIGMWLYTNVRTKRVKNSVPEMFRTSDTPDMVEELDAVSVNACFVVGLYISKEIEVRTKGRLRLDIHKMGKSYIYYNVPTIEIMKLKVYMDPNSMVRNTIDRSREFNEPVCLGNVLWENLKHDDQFSSLTKGNVCG